MFFLENRPSFLIDSKKVPWNAYLSNPHQSDSKERMFLDNNLVEIRTFIRENELARISIQLDHSHWQIHVDSS